MRGGHYLKVHREGGAGALFLDGKGKETNKLGRVSKIIDSSTTRNGDQPRGGGKASRKKRG